MSKKAEKKDITSAALPKPSASSTSAEEEGHAASVADAVINDSIRLIRTYSEAAATLPISSIDDYEYQSAFTDFGPSMNKHARSCKAIVETFSRALVSERRLRQRLASSGGSGSGAAVAGVEGDDNLYGVVDTLFEDIDTILDDLKGSSYRTDLQTQLNQATAEGSSSSSGTAPVAAGGAFSGPASGAAIVVVPRPQLQFERPVDNTDAPNLPLLFSEPKGEPLQRTTVAHEHPFDDLLREYPLNPRQLRHRAEEVSRPVETTPLHLVGTPEQLDEMIAELSAAAEGTVTPTTVATSNPFDRHFDFSHSGIKDMFGPGGSFATFVPKHKEIAIDLEHHDLHSFQGITCLCQISTRTDDYLVDVLALRSHLYRMNRFLLNPKIVKVLHGCREDVRWLQKDFGCYVANIFDTGAALQAMRMPYSLAFAVDHFCQVKLDKKYQLADWRKRPLSSEMVKYARLDTHYLLYIHDRLTNNLIGFESKTAIGNVLLHVLEEGRRLCRLVYEMPRLDAANDFKEVLGRSLVGMRPAQLEVTRRVFNWRDRVAREDDESPLAVMHPASVIQLGLRCGASSSPPTASMVLSAVKPVSMSVRVHLSRLLVEISAAVAASASSLGAADSITAAAAFIDDNAADKQQVSAARYQVAYCPQTGTLPSLSTPTTTDLIAVPSGFVLSGDTFITSTVCNKTVLGVKRGRDAEAGSNSATTVFSTFYSDLSASIQPPTRLRAAAAAVQNAASSFRGSTAHPEHGSKEKAPLMDAEEEVQQAIVVDEAGVDGFLAIPPPTTTTEDSIALPATEDAAPQPQEGFKSIRQMYGGLGRDSRRGNQQQQKKL